MHFGKELFGHGSRREILTRAKGGGLYTKTLGVFLWCPRLETLGGGTECKIQASPEERGRETTKQKWDGNGRISREG